MNHMALESKAISDNDFVARQLLWDRLVGLCEEHLLEEMDVFGHFLEARSLLKHRVVDGEREIRECCLKVINMPTAGRSGLHFLGGGGGAGRHLRRYVVGPILL